MELSRRFAEHYTRFAGKPDMQRLRAGIEALVDERKKLVTAVRATVDRYADPGTRRIFDTPDFNSRQGVRRCASR